MATTTTNLGLTKPALSESADVGVINDNSDKIDVEAGKSRANLAATYSASSAYAVGDYCERGGNLFRCTTAIGSGGEAWNSGHWTRVAVTGEIPKVVDNLTTNDAAKALSAKQGKALKDLIDTSFAAGEITSGTLTANTETEFVVSFGETMKAAPIVFATIYSNATTVVFTVHSVYDISTTGFKVKIKNQTANDTSLSSNRRISWFAFCP